MKIVISGAGDVGFHLAKLLSHESQDITIIDKDKNKLARIDQALDVFTVRGDSTSFKIQKEAKVEEADIFIAVTNFQNTNLMSALIAKKLGVSKSIARINNNEYLERENLIAIQRAGIDALISPEKLAANEIKFLIEQSAFNEIHSFEDGKLELFGTMLNQDSPLINKSIRETSAIKDDGALYSPVAIIRFSQEKSCYKTIIPRGDTIYKTNDQVYFLSVPDGVDKIYQLLGKNRDKLSKNIVIGGGEIGTKTAKMLKESGHKVKLIERSAELAEDLAEELQGILVILGDGRDGDLLHEEGISEMDAFIAVTGRSETNIMACLLAKSKGVKKTIALVENIDYIHLSQEIGIDAFINKKLLAANEIFRFVRKGDVLDVTNLSDLDAEVLEFKLYHESKLAGKSIRQCGFPKNAIIGGVIRDGKGYIPTADFIMKSGDRVVVMAQPEAIAKLEKFF